MNFMNILVIGLFILVFLIILWLMAIQGYCEYDLYTNGYAEHVIKVHRGLKFHKMRKLNQHCQDCKNMADASHRRDGHYCCMCNFIPEYTYDCITGKISIKDKPDIRFYLKDANLCESTYGSLSCHYEEKEGE